MSFAVKRLLTTVLILIVAFCNSSLHAAGAEASDKLQILFLGDRGHHRPGERSKQLIPVMKQRGIDITYTENVDDLNSHKLNRYDALIVYANIGKITPQQESALLDYVERGGGFVPLHCASYCFLNSPKYIALVGAQFKRHGGGIFRVNKRKADHPIMKDFKGFESWDETYVHAKHNEKDRVVLETRTEGTREEPWTWIRTQGKGRVFYTAWGHDGRTWSNEGFHNLVERGIRWTTEQRLIAKAHPRGPKTGLKPFKYVDAEGKVPFYPPGRGWGKIEKNPWKMQLPAAPEKSMKHVVTPAGFKVELFASEPDIKPSLAMAWDERGRLWVAETIDYPNELQKEGEGRDSIKICEDTNGDGKADKFTVFADKLSICSAITFYRGGVIAQDGTRTLYLKDTNGDDRADVRKILITGWNMRDTHGGVGNFHYGMDNWFWAMQGYNNSSPQFNGKSGPSFRMGFFRFRLDRSDPPNVTDVEFIRSTNNNTWGLGFSEEGIVFGSTANNNPSVYMPIANRYYERVRGWSASRLGGIADPRFNPISDKVRQVDAHGRYTAGAGHALYTARVYPREYWNRTAFVNGPTGKLTGVFEIFPDGADFRSSNNWNLVASDDEWFAPIMSEVGPDGCMWVLDWYNYIIQHNPTPHGFKTGKGNAYLSDIRDKKHCRIYRVVPETPASSSGKQPTGLTKDNFGQQLKALKSTNRFWRLHAQRLLVESNNNFVVGELVKMVNDRSTDAIGLNVSAIHALWTLQGMGALNASEFPAYRAAVGAMRHPSAGVRRNAVKVLPPATASLEAILDSNIINDNDAQVRLSAFLALSDMPNTDSSLTDRAGAAIFAALKQPRNADDRWIPDAITAAAATHDAGFLRAALGGSEAKGVKEEPKKKQPKPSQVNLVKNASFEEIHNNLPAQWRKVTYSGQATHTIEKGFGRTGKTCVKITSTRGADSSWTFDLPVKRHTRYRLSAWIKTKNVKGGANGVLLNLHELQHKGKTRGQKGTRDWTRVTSEFETGGRSKIGLNLLFGGWGRCTGEAWWDDIEVIEIGPATGQPAPLASGPVSGRAGQVVSIVTRHYGERGPVESVVDTLTALRGADEQLASFILEGLATGWPKGTAPEVTDVDRAQLGLLMKSLPTAQRDRLLVLANKWGQTDIFSGDVAAVVKTMKSQLTKGNANARIDAAKRLIRLEDTPDNIDLILKQITPQSPPPLAVGLINAATDSRHNRTGGVIVSKWNQFSPLARRTAVSVLMRRPSWTFAMFTAIENGDIHRGELSAADWQILSTHSNKNVANTAKKLNVLAANPDRQKVFEKMLPITKMKGDATKGAAIFKKTCSQCHTIDGDGGQVGPDLTGIGTRDVKDILAEIVDPNRSLEANFRMWNIELSLGDNLSGRLDTETRTTVELFDLNGKRHVIQRDEIENMRALPVSIMPVGLIDQMPQSDVASLLEFLTQSRGHGKE